MILPRTLVWSRRDRRRVLTLVGHHRLRCALRQVHAMLLRSAERTEGLLLRDPPPFVLQTALGDFYVEDQFNEHGVQIMSPHFMHQPERPVVVPKHRWFEPPAEREAKG